MDDIPVSASRAIDNVEKALVITAIRKAAAENGGLPPAETKFRRATGFPGYTWRGKHWARWSDALSEAGFSSHRRSGKDEEHLLAKLADAVRHYQRIPTVVEMTHYARSHPGFPTQVTLIRRFQTKHNLIDRLRRWAKPKPEMADIAVLCSRERNRAVRRDELPAVYLLRAGEFFKIGWTNTLLRRIEDLQAGLPEVAELVHVIRTPDPRGTEALWHRRFSGKRVRGEWFRLAPEDVATFCSDGRQ